MSYAADLDVVARTLAVLAVHGSAALSARDLDIALVGRASVLELATTVQFDLTGLRGRMNGMVGTDLEAHPAAAFAVALERYPQVRGRLSPSDALSRTADSDVGTAWQRVARHALSATHHWSAGGFRPRDDVAWAGLADIAAICSVLTELDADLAECADPHVGREDVCAQLAKASTFGLRVAARQVGELARLGPLPDRGPEPRPRDNHGQVTITKPDDIARAHQQFSNLLNTARHVRPERLSLFMVGHLRVCRAVLNAWSDHGSDVRAELAEHERLLTEVTRFHLPAASVDPGDLRPLRQAQIIRQACSPGSPLLREADADPRHMIVLAGALAETTVALQECADRQVRSGAWILTDQESEELRWLRLQSWQSPPRFVVALRAAAVHAVQVSTLATPPAPAEEARAVPPSKARDLLRPAPFQPLDPRRIPQRPPQPSLPITRYHPRASWSRSRR